MLPPFRADLLDRYRRNRERSRALFELVSEEAYYSAPIALRHPIVFYEGHLPGFSFNTLVKKGLGGASIDPRLEDLFARGIDPPESTAGGTRRAPEWPSRDVVQAFAEEADRRVCIGGPRSKDSYLHIEHILQAAEQLDCQAVHPGYGFLAQNPRFAAMCGQAKVTFLGPEAVHAVAGGAAAHLLAGSWPLSMAVNPGLEVGLAPPALAAYIVREHE